MNQSVPAEHAVVGGLLRRRGRRLARPPLGVPTLYPDVWDLPGGHVQKDETPHLALVRELREELGIIVEAADEPFARLQEGDCRMDIWVIDEWSGEPSNCEVREHHALVSVTGEEAHGLRLADPRRLQLLHAALRRAE